MQNRHTCCAPTLSLVGGSYSVGRCLHRAPRPRYKPTTSAWLPSKLCSQQALGKRQIALTLPPASASEPEIKLVSLSPSCLPTVPGSSDSPKCNHSGMQEPGLQGPTPAPPYFPSLTILQSSGCALGPPTALAALSLRRVLPTALPSTTTQDRSKDVPPPRPQTPQRSGQEERGSAGTGPERSHNHH